MSPKVRKSLIVFLAIAVLAVLVLSVLTCGTTPQPPTLPNPNGYDDFLKAAGLLTGDIGNATALEHDELRKLILTNAEPLRLLRVGLSRECSVPTDAAITNLSATVSDISKLKSLVRLVVEEGRLAEMENRPADAARNYIDVIQCGNEISRGGFLIHRLIGLSFEMMGFNAFTKLMPKLGREQVRPRIVELEKIDNARVTWDEIVQNEKRFARHLSLNPINRVTSWWLSRGFEKKTEERHQKMAARLRLVTAELALRCFQSEQGRGPERLEQLVPKLLQRVPLDPFSSHPLVYRAQGTNWLLYSFGVDGVDDGGVPVGPSVSGTVTKGDLFFDSPL